MKRGEKSATIRSSVRDHYREEVRPVSEHSGSGERTLYDLTPGESGMILSVGNQSGAVKRRLVDMGLTPGTVVKVTKIAPLGDPLEVSLRGYEMSLRRADAAQIRMGQPRRTERGGTARGAMTRHVTDPETARRQLRDHEHELQEHGGSYDPTAHDTRPMRVALAGNPNCGKTTLFNALTGSNQYVGNWPGVTVEKKEGTARLGDKTLTIVDLPGIYSLSPYSMEEIVARDFIIGEAPDCIIDIVDATNLERNLYLTVQLLELERPTVLALNFMDEVEIFVSAEPGIIEKRRDFHGHTVLCDTIITCHDSVSALRGFYTLGASRMG